MLELIRQQIDILVYHSLGQEPLNSAGFIIYSVMEKVRALLDKLEFDTDVSRKISSLRIRQQQIMEIAKARSFDVRVLINDESTSALSESDTNTMLNKLALSTFMEWKCFVGP